MNKFEEELIVGNFVIGECSNCSKIVWPPSNFCNKCFSNVKWRKISPKGKLIEWSKIGNDVFCITEFENAIRIIGKIDTKNSVLKPGQLVKLSKCALNKKPKFFFSIE